MAHVTAVARLRVVVLLCAAALLSAFPVQAACPDDPPATPGASMQFVSVTPEGMATFTVTWNFPEPTTTAMTVYWTQDGGGPNFVDREGSSSGAKTVQAYVGCIPPGSHTWTAYAVASCAGGSTTGSGSVSRSFDNKPKVSIEVGPVVNGHVDGKVTYEFPNTTTGELSLTYNGYVQQEYSLGREGVRDFRIATSCWPTGSYPIIANAKACTFTDPTAVASSAGVITVDTTPVIESVSYVGPDASGNLAVTVKYDFKKNVFGDADQGLWVNTDGEFRFWGLSSVRKGEWTFTLARGCWTTLTVYARACRTANPVFNDSQSISPPLPKPTVELSLAKLGKNSAGKRIIMAQTSYDVKKLGAQVQIRLLKWIETNGQVHAGGLLRQFTPDPTTGKDAFTFHAPSNARQVVLQAKVVGVCEPVIDEAGIECAPCDNASKNPVYYSDGNVKVDDGDPLPRVSQWSLARSYDSDEQTGGLFGRGWTTLFDRRVIVDTDTVSVTTESNEVVVFRQVPGGFQQTWPTNQRGPGTLAYDAGAGTYTYRAPGSTVEAVFRASDGRIVTLRNRAAAGEAVITYDALGQPATFADTATAVTWNLTIDAQRHVTAVAVAGRPDLVWGYVYDGAGNLTTVTAPGNATWRTYEYSNNYMTASRDALGNLIESHTYDADGFGISSTGDVDEIANIQYNLPGSVPEERITRITYRTGAQAEYALRPIGGAMRPVQISGGCSSCGASEGTFVRDVHGRVVLHQGADGYISRTVYAGDYVLSEERPLKPAGCDPNTDAQGCRLGTDALAVATLETTSATVMTTYSHGDPLWPDRVTEVSRPSVREPGQFRNESYGYHLAMGAMVSTAVSGWDGQGPTAHVRATQTTLYGDLPGCPGPCPPFDPYAPAFDPGGSFQSAWLALPQPAYLPKAVDGPRTDAEDVTSMVYFPVDATVPALLRGHLAATLNAAGHITRYEDYDVFGNATRIVHPNGVATEMTFDALGRLLTSTIKGVAGCDTGVDALCATDLTVTRAYTSGAGPLLLEQRPAGGVTTYTYDARGRVQTISRGPAANDLRERIETTYDALTGKKSLERMLAYEAGVWVEKRRDAFAYDSQARLQTVTHADATSMAYTYDRAERLATVRDENHAAPNTFYTYDPAGRLESVSQTLATAPAGVIASHYTYDTNGNLTSLTDPNGNVTSYVYDDFGQLLSQQSPVTGGTAYVYDIAGNLTQSADANGGTTARTYDALGRVLTACSSRTGVATETVTWNYDDATTGQYGVGRLASMGDPSGTTLYRYERRGFLREEDGTLTYAGYSYDADGNRLTLGMAEYAYDFAGRPISISSYGTPLVNSVTYLPFGPLTGLTYGNGAVKTTEYDARYRPTRNKLTLSSTVVADYVYQHDAAGNITQIHDAVDAAYNRDFAYDDLNRLVTANTGTALWGNGSYTYDAMGNMTSLSLGSWRSSAFSYVGSTPKLASVNGVPVAYDSAGNEAADISARNLLAFESGSANYAYDGRGVRVKESLGLFQTSTPFTRIFQYSPDLRLLHYTDTVINQTWSSSIVWLDALPVGQLPRDPFTFVLEGDLSGFRYTFTDHLGTPLLQMDGADVVWRAEYEPYGSIYEMRAGNAGDQRLRFPGQEASGQNNGDERYYNIFRWYRPGWGRYTQADPMDQPGLEYRYALSNPVLYTDVLGLKDTSGFITKPPGVLSKCLTKVPWLSKALGPIGFAISIFLTDGLNENENTPKDCDKCTVPKPDDPPDNVVPFPKPWTVPPDGPCDARWFNSLMWIQENIPDDAQANKMIQDANNAYKNCKAGLPTIFPGGK